MRKILTLSLFLLPLPALAQGTPSPGMKTLEFISDKDAAILYDMQHGDQPPRTTEPEAAGPPPAAPQEKSESPASIYAPKTLVVIPDGAEPLKEPGSTGLPQGAQANDAPNPQTKPENIDILEQAGLWPRSKLSIWDKGYLITLARTPAQMDAAIAAFEKTPSRANPQDLMDIATLYAARKNMPLAARYYYAAQLRHAFDVARFPIQPERKLQGSSSTPMIGTWATSTSERMAAVIVDVQDWDAKTGYHYRPSFPLPHPDQNLGVPAESDWLDILSRTRETYFKDLSEISRALGRMGK